MNDSDTHPEDDPQPQAGGGEVHDYLAFARELAQRARALVLDGIRCGFAVNVKADTTCVTEIDTAVETALRAEIVRRYPAHGILGEEMPPANPEADYRWILDPVDGTDNLAHGIPTFGTIIALHYRGTPLVGVIDHPLLDLTYSAGRGTGAFCNGRRITVDDYREVSSRREMVVTTAPENFMKTGDLDALTRIQEAFPNTRIYRDCFAHTRVFQGSAGAMVDANLRLWDLAASQVLVEEAGGRFVRVREVELEGRTYYTVVFGQADLVERLVPLVS